MSVVEQARVVCTPRWQDGAGRRLAAVLDDRPVRRLRRTGSGSCKELAALARRIEEATATTGEAAGRAAAAVAGFLPWGQHAERIAEALVTRTVLAAGGPVSEELVRHLRVIGVWSCAVTGRLESCACLRDLAAGRTLEWVRSTLAVELTALRPATA